MEPLLPPMSGALRDLALELTRAAAALEGVLHPISRQAVAGLARRAASYYSNLIEGHDTHPRDLEAALRRKLARDPALRARQLEARAHVEVHALLDDRLAREAELDPASAGFLAWLHRELYGRMPEAYRVLRVAGGGEAEVVPGGFREREVEVGAHVAPHHRAVPALLARFGEVYGMRSRGGLERVVAAAAAHHRLLWIHPFLDGNGRVARLASHAFLARAGVAGGGLWSIARGLARRRSEYLAALAAADEPRRGDLDGRGNLTAAGLSDFCELFLGSALDQVRFMAGLLDLPGLSARVLAYAERRAARGELRPGAGLLLREALLRGEVPRGDAPRVLGLRERTARKVVADLAAEGLLTSTTPKGPLRLAITAEAAPWYFPQLYPPAVEQS